MALTDKEKEQLEAYQNGLNLPFDNQNTEFTSPTGMGVLQNLKKRLAEDDAFRAEAHQYLALFAA